MARLMIADGRGHDVFPASEEELLHELRRLDGQFRAEREPRIAVIYADPEADVTPKLSIGLGADQATVCYDHGLSSALVAVAAGARARSDIRTATGTRSSLNGRWCLKRMLSPQRRSSSRRVADRPTWTGSMNDSSRAGRAPLRPHAPQAAPSASDDPHIPDAEIALAWMPAQCQILNSCAAADAARGTPKPLGEKRKDCLATNLNPSASRCRRPPAVNRAPFPASPGVSTRTAKAYAQT